MSKFWVEWELTDTFAGEANYCWVKRGVSNTRTKSISARAAVRMVKKQLDWTGKRCKVEDYGDQLVLRPANLLQVCFIAICSE